MQGSSSLYSIVDWRLQSNRPVPPCKFIYHSFFAFLLQYSFLHAINGFLENYAYPNKNSWISPYLDFKFGAKLTDFFLWGDFFKLDVVDHKKEYCPLAYFHLFLV